MLIEKTNQDNRSLELHHLGKLKLRMQVRNPDAKDYIHDDWEQPMIGTCYRDEYLYRDIEHDFYYTYERLERKRVIETVSFTLPIILLGDKLSSAGRKALLMRLIPSQHPAVTRYDYDCEPADFFIPIGSENFYGWQFFKTNLKKSVKREVRNERYDFLIENNLGKNVKVFIPGGLFEPLYKSAPLYVLDVLDLVDFDLIEPVPLGYHKYFRPRLSQKLLCEH